MTVTDFEYWGGGFPATDGPWSFQSGLVHDTDSCSLLKYHT